MSRTGPGSSPTSEALEQLLRRYYQEVWARGDGTLLEQLLADDYVDHNPPPGVGADKQSGMRLVNAFTSGRQGASFDTLEILIENERAAAHWTMHWTHRGQLMGMPADGKELRLRGHDFFHFRANQISDIWHCEDLAGLMARRRAP